MKESELYIVKDGTLKLLDKPASGFGKTVIHWQDGKPITVEVNYTNKI
ncbi:DUF3954 domain-containing protein [Niallia circulans]|uniref:DUF3954 domain-containing protein n=1 Tax=Niallia circulans TaxID=1397 RepID=A0A941JS00_NIACI|nr:DUF3954 domain-containing protein [Niallia circulans]MCB5238907.1 DUF3954 domain-containing protein [Niallia circulans]